jgi:hypothetical protein
MSRRARPVEENIQEEPVLNNTKEPTKTTIIPDLKIYGVQIDGLKNKIDEIKLSNRKQEFINKVKTVLDLFDKDSNHYSDTIVFFVMSCIENFHLKKNSGAQKLELVKECVKEYFNNDDLLINKIVQLLMPKLKQNKFIKRNMKKMFRFFFH